MVTSRTDTAPSLTHRIRTFRHEIEVRAGGQIPAVRTNQQILCKPFLNFSRSNLSASKLPLLSLLLVSTVALAEASADVSPLKLAASAGFNGCNDLINQTFDYAQTAAQRLYLSEYFPETSSVAINLSVTFGKVGDTIFQTAQIAKAGGYCFSSLKTIFSSNDSCTALVLKDQNFKYTTDTAGAIWTKNTRGDTRVLIQAGSICTQIYSISMKQATDK